MVYGSLLLGGQEESPKLPNWPEPTFPFKSLLPWDRRSGNLSPFRPDRLRSSSSGLPVQLLPKCPSPWRWRLSPSCVTSHAHPALPGRSTSSRARRASPRFGAAQRSFGNHSPQQREPRNLKSRRRRIILAAMRGTAGDREKNPSKELVPIAARRWEVCSAPTTTHRLRQQQHYNTGLTEFY